MLAFLDLRLADAQSPVGGLRPVGEEGLENLPTGQRAGVSIPHTMIDLYPLIHLLDDDPPPGRALSYECPISHPQQEQTERRMMDFEHWKQRQKEILREAERDRVTKALRAVRERRARTWSLRWEVKRIAGRLLKSLRSSK